MKLVVVDVTSVCYITQSPRSVIVTGCNASFGIRGKEDGRAQDTQGQRPSLDRQNCFVRLRGRQ